MEACQHLKYFHVQTIFRWPEIEIDTITGETEMSEFSSEVPELRLN